MITVAGTRTMFVSLEVKATVTGLAGGALEETCPKPTKVPVFSAAVLGIVSVRMAGSLSLTVITFVAEMRFVADA